MIKKLSKLLDREQKLKSGILFGMMVIASFLEMLSLGLIIPILGLFLNSQNIPYINILNNFGIDDFSNEELFTYFLLFFLLLYVLKISLLIFMSWYEQNFIAKFREEFSNKMFSKYITQNISFFSGKNSSQFLRNIMTEIEHLSIYMLSFFMATLEILTISSLTIVLLYVDFSITLTTICLFIFVTFLYLKIIRPKVRQWGITRHLSESKRIQFLQEGFGAVKDIKLLGREKFFFDKFKFHNLNLRDVAAKIGFVNQLPRFVLELFIIITIILIFIILNEKNNSFVDVLTVLALFLAAAFRIMPSLNRLIGSFQNMKFTSHAAEMLSKEMDLLTKENKNKKEKIKKITFTNNISVDIKNFKYNDSDKFMIKDINFSIKKGEKIGIIGPSGSGKSTFIEILLGILKPQNGQVNIDGNSIDAISNLKEIVGYIPQKIFILDDSLRNNILFGLKNDDFKDEKIIEIIKKTNLTGLLNRLKDGLNSRLGERGVDLSGGEIQRIGIARALIYDPEIIFLDEATSSLDTFTERAILNELKNFDNKTFISVAHRVGTLKNCNKIYLISQGKITDSGDFQKFINY
tara:strand:+ start:4036 stop:5766 length:1731 start_codon:yes stop_codon:yes gene_type:complete